MDFMKMKSYARNISVESEYGEEMSGDESVQDIEEVLYQAKKEDRLITGIFECARVLENCPDVVSLCVLPGGQTKNISMHIQQKLIEAFCWEYDITIVTVDDSAISGLVKNNRTKSDATDLQCFLLTSSKFEMDIDQIEVEDCIG